MEYALGLDANSASTASLLQIVIADGFLTIPCPHAKAATDITLRAVWSTALTGWSETGLTEEILADDGTTQTVRAKALIAPDTKKFLRLEVTRP